MLTITVPAVDDGWDPVKREFIQTKETTLQMEHSLLSISKWESKFKKPFLSKEEKTYAESLYYYKCMTITQNVSDDIYRVFSKDIANQIAEYINDPMTATTITHLGKQNKKQEIVTAEIIYYWMVSYRIKRKDKKGSKKIITNELIYFWMANYGIPFDPCQKWHLNRLLSLIEVCSIKNNPDDKMSKKEALAHQKALNNARRAKYAASKRGGK